MRNVFDINNFKSVVTHTTEEDEEKTVSALFNHARYRSNNSAMKSANNSAE